MNITLALGLHFDNSQKNNASAQRPEHGSGLHGLPAAGPVIDVLPEPEARVQPGFGGGQKLLLTYNFRGLSEPIWVDISMLSIYV